MISRGSCPIAPGERFPADVIAGSEQAETKRTTHMAGVAIELKLNRKQTFIGPISKLD